MPPIVFVHGLSASSRWWRAVLPLLDGREARLLDLPRFGRHFHPDGVTDWLVGEVESEAPVVLVGHSMGGLVCARLAAERPELVHALVLIAPAGAPGPRSLASYATGLARTFLSVRPGLLRTIAEDAIRTGPEALVHGALFATGAGFTGEVTAPTLLIWGARDRLMPVELANDWRRAIPGARVEVIEDAAHVPMVETPSAFAERLLNFLDGLEDGAGV
jgi:pimeloyl-ACP methyl ester carboxylesterase